MKKVLAMIPARMGSTRLKNKMLLEVNGTPIICHTVEQVLKAEYVGRIVVCTDSQEIFDEVNSYFFRDLRVFPTYDALTCETGTDRTSITLLEHAQFKDGMSDECILHVHGDEACINPESLDELVEHHINTVPHASMTQLITKTCDKDNVRHSCKVDVGWDGNIIKGYSRDQTHFYTALGAFAFDPIALLAFHKFPIGPNEHRMKIEQYRLIENGVVVRGFDSGLGDVKTSIDTKVDLDRMASLMQEY